MKKKKEFNTLDEMFACLLKHDRDRLAKILLKPLNKHFDVIEDERQKVLNAFRIPPHLLKRGVKYEKSKQ